MCGAPCQRMGIPVEQVTQMLADVTGIAASVGLDRDEVVRVLEQARTEWEAIR